MAWNGKEVLDMLVAKHGKPTMDAETGAALQRLFAIILWGELAAWRISAQLADRLAPMEAKMAATSQVHNEARHFYVMYDYLSMLGDVPKTLDYAPRKRLKMILRTDNLAYKLLGMQLMVETLALTIFQARILAFGMWEIKVIEKDLVTLGLNPEKGMVIGLFSSAGELLFPDEATQGDRRAKMNAALRAIRGDLPDVNEDEMTVHETHDIMTAQATGHRDQKRRANQRETL